MYFVVKELGGRSTDPNVLDSHGHIDYNLLAKTKLFNDGLIRLRNGMQNYRVALMCTEKDPISCHRAILICRFIRNENYSVEHILEKGNLESHRELEIRLLKSMGLPNKDLFFNESQILEQAYDAQGKIITQHLINNDFKHTYQNTFVKETVQTYQNNFAKETIQVYTIGFTKKSAESFFKSLHTRGVKRILDIRLNNSSQLAGFTKKDDLRYFLRSICNIDYKYVPELAPSRTILDNYKQNRNDWMEYERLFFDLMAERKIENLMTMSILDKACFLCSEDKPDKCHRRLVAEYLKNKLGNIEIIHL